VNGQLAWYVGGPVLGLCVVACRVLFNGRLGVTGGFSELVDQIRHRSLAFDWRGWFALGVLGGGVVYALVHGGPGFDGYGWLTDSLADVWVAIVLLISGVAIGYGAKVAGGCTSGNGLAGTASFSPAALAATATFFATAIVINFAIEAVV
jgi:uncharacterized protein